MRRESEARAKAIGVQLLPFEASVPEQLADVLAAAAQKHSDALVVLSDPMFNFNRRRLVEAAAQHRLSAVYEWRESVEAGGLMAYGPNFTDLFRRAATYVDRRFTRASPESGKWSMGNRPSCSFRRIWVRRASASIGTRALPPIAPHARTTSANSRSRSRSASSSRRTPPIVH